MSILARNQITITDLRGGEHTYLRYSDDGGKTFTAASQKASDEALASWPLEVRNLVDVTTFQGVTVTDRNNYGFRAMLRVNSNLFRMSFLMPWADASWEEKPYVISGFVKASSYIEMLPNFGDVYSNDNKGWLKPTSGYTYFEYHFPRTKYIDAQYKGFLDFDIRGHTTDTVVEFLNFTIGVGQIASAFSKQNIIGIDKAPGMTTLYGRNLATYNGYGGGVISKTLAGATNETVNIASVNGLAGGNIVQMSCKIEFINCEISEKSTYWAQACNTNEWGWGYNAPYGSVVANGVIDYHWSNKLPKATKDGVLALRFDYIKGTVRISEPCVTIGDTRYPYSPAPEDQLFGTTPGAWLGTAVSDKPYPPTSVDSYTWSKIQGKDGRNGTNSAVIHLYAKGEVKPSAYATGNSGSLFWDFGLARYTNGDGNPGIGDTTTDNAGKTWYLSPSDDATWCIEATVSDTANRTGVWLAHWSEPYMYKGTKGKDGSGLSLKLSKESLTVDFGASGQRTTDFNSAEMAVEVYVLRNGKKEPIKQGSLSLPISEQKNCTVGLCDDLGKPVNGATSYIHPTDYTRHEITGDNGRTYKAPVTSASAVIHATTADGIPLTATLLLFANYSHAVANFMYQNDSITAKVEGINVEQGKQRNTLSELSVEQKKIGSRVQTLEGNSAKYSTIEQTDERIAMHVGSRIGKNLYPVTMWGVLNISYGHAPIGINAFRLVPGMTYTLTVEGFISNKLYSDGGVMRIYLFDNAWKFSAHIDVPETRLTRRSVTFTVPTDKGLSEATDFFVNIYPYDRLTENGMNKYADDYRSKDRGPMYVRSIWLEAGTASSWAYDKKMLVWHPNLLPSGLMSVNSLSYNGYDGKLVFYGNEDNVAAGNSPTQRYERTRTLSVARNGSYALAMDYIFNSKYRQTYTLSFYAKGTGTLAVYTYRASGAGLHIADGAIFDGVINNDHTYNMGKAVLTDTFVRHEYTVTFMESVPVDLVFRLEASTSQDSYMEYFGVKLEEYGFATSIEKPLTTDTARESGMTMTEDGVEFDADRFSVRNNKGRNIFNLDANGNMVAGSLTAMGADGGLYTSVKPGAFELGLNDGGMMKSYFDLAVTEGNTVVMRYLDGNGNVIGLIDAALFGKNGKDIPNTYSEISLTALATPTNRTPTELDVENALDLIIYGNVHETKYYTLLEGYTQTVAQIASNTVTYRISGLSVPSKYDKKTFRSMSYSDGNFIPDGWYTHFATARKVPGASYVLYKYAGGKEVDRKILELKEIQS